MNALLQMMMANGMNPDWFSPMPFEGRTPRKKGAPIPFNFLPNMGVPNMGMNVPDMGMMGGNRRMPGMMGIRQKY